MDYVCPVGKCDHYHGDNYDCDGNYIAVQQALRNGIAEGAATRQREILAHFESLFKPPVHTPALAVEKMMEYLKAGE